MGLKIIKNSLYINEYQIFRNILTNLFTPSETW